MRLLSLLGAITFFLIGTSVQAHPHRSHHIHHRHMRVPVPDPRPTYSNNFFSNWFKPWAPAPQVPTQTTRRFFVHQPREEHFEREEHETSFNRPSDCYGIAWCGCFLRHYFGLADRSLNSAFEWTHVGHPTTAHNGAVVVWRHHVGILRSDPVDGRALVLSGNDGHRVRLRAVSLRGAIAYRDM
jgi:hypothetical protein